MKLLDQIRLACDGATVEVPHQLGTAVGTVVAFDMRGPEPVIVVAIDGMRRDVVVPLDVLDWARVEAP